MPVTTKEKIIREIEELPAPVLNEIMDFVQFLKQKKEQAPSETMFLSEAALEKDWLNEAEDEAWKNL